MGGWVGVGLVIELSGRNDVRNVVRGSVGEVYCWITYDSIYDSVYGNIYSLVEN